MPIPLIFTEGEGEQRRKHHAIHKEGPGEDTWILALALPNIEEFCSIW